MDRPQRLLEIEILVLFFLCNANIAAGRQAPVVRLRFLFGRSTSPTLRHRVSSALGKRSCNQSALPNEIPSAAEAPRLRLARSSIQRLAIHPINLGISPRGRTPEPQVRSPQRQPPVRPASTSVRSALSDPCSVGPCIAGLRGPYEGRHCPTSPLFPPSVQSVARAATSTAKAH